MSDLEVEASPGSFSFESSLYRAIVSLDKFPAVFHREILLIQSSPMTKDQHDLSPTIKLLKDAEVRLNVLSLCGWTEVIKVFMSLSRDQCKRSKESMKLFTKKNNW